MGGAVPPPFDTSKKCTFAYDMTLKLYSGEISLSRLALEKF